MKHLLLALGLMAVLFVCPPTVEVLAGTGKCHRIKNRDQRNLCLGLATRNIGKCGAIKNKDLAQYCRAKIRRSKSMCLFIKNPRLKKKCLAELKRPSMTSVRSISWS